MLLPRWTVYWHYFTDDSMAGHYFGGVGPEILGTLLVTVLAIAFALPVGVITAGYLVECAADTLPTRMLRMAVNTLAGVPSIVFGLFGLAFFVIYLLPKLGLPEGSSIIAGALTLGLLVLPVVIRASEEAIRAVPQAYREAALSLGASRFRCFITVTLPAALPGILTGLILSMSRAAGETAPILFTAAVAMGPIPTSLAQPTRTLAYSSYDMAVGDKMAALAPHNQFGMVTTLIAIVLLLNARRHRAARQDLKKTARPVTTAKDRAVTQNGSWDMLELQDMAARTGRTGGDDKPAETPIRQPQDRPAADARAADHPG